MTTTAPPPEVIASDARTRPSRRSAWRPRSLRLRAVLVSVAVALLPVVVVVVSRPIETGLAGRMEDRVARAAREAAAASERRTDGDDATVADVARRWSVRVRVVDSNRDAGGAVRVDVDHDADSWLGAASDLLLGGPNAPSPAAFEATLPPVPARDEARRGGSLCRTSPDGRAILCSAAARRTDGAIVYATHSSRRPVGALLDVRYEIIKLSLVLLPAALLLGLYLGWRFDAAAAALAERARKNEDFVADLTHEMKNPLAAIRAAAEVVDDGTPRGARLGRVCGDASRRLDALVSALLELARVDAGLSATTTLDVAALVRNVVDARTDRDRFTVETAPLVVRAAPRELESAVRNLLDNAASFGAAVRVRTTPSTLVVEDDGPGIPADALPRVFDRFFTTRGDRHGTGLGLALTKAVVEAHGGRIVVDSPPTGGARFTIAFA